MIESTKTPQRVLVFNHLKTHGYITDVVAQSYGIRRLASRILDLKTLGFVIDVEMRRDDLGRRYAYYTLNLAASCDDVKDCSVCSEIAAQVPGRHAA